MSHTDNTQQKFDKRFPEWLEFKVWIKKFDPQDGRHTSRQAEKQSWRRDIRMELSA